VPALGESPRLVVAILTYRRPERLSALLASLPPRLSEVDLPTSVLVIDNDPDQSARTTTRASHGLDLRYVAEPRPGIAAARARALDEASSFRLLAFLDDDELPTPGWLSALVRTWTDTGATAVMGRVVTVFPADTDPWVLASGLFRRPRRPTGTVLEAAAAGNLLLDLNEVRRLGVQFDARLGLSGGEDTLFSRHLHRAGGTIVWCDESVAEDHVEPTRLTKPWALRRARGHGQAHVRTHLRLASPATRPAIRGLGLVGGSLRVLAGAARQLLGRATGSLHHEARGSRMTARGLGMISASLGRTLLDYEREAPVIPD
jgi:succinoglycan biosynthesis protein ExoM